MSAQCRQAGKTALLLGTPMGDHLTWPLMWCAGLVVGFLPAALWACRRRV